MSRETAGRVYRALLRLAPRRLRERHAAEMESLFLERSSEARARGGFAPALWTKAVLDLPPPPPRIGAARGSTRGAAPRREGC
jgi:hypothetical protein